MPVEDAAMSNTRAAGNPASGNNQSGGQPAGSGQQQNLEVSRWSPSTSSGAPSTTVDSNAATWGSAVSDTSRQPATVEENRQQALNILQGGAREPEPNDSRAAERVISRITEDPVSADQASSSGHRAKNRRK